MPILAPEPAVFPEALFDSPPCVEGEPPVWWVLHTLPRQEKWLARFLYHARIPYYLPQVSRRCCLRGRVLVSSVPLFPGYLFLYSADEQRVQALSSKRVARCLRTADQEGIWHDLGQIYR